MKDYDTTTVAGVASFPVEDITHKPKRMQGDMYKLKQKLEEVDNPDTPEESDDEGSLKVITLERAIAYYKSKSNDEKNGELYKATAKWLSELLVTRSSKTLSKAVSNEESVEEILNEI